MGVDDLDEGIRGVKANRAGQKPEGKNDEGCVAKVQQGRDKSSDLELGLEVKDGVGEDVERRPARDKETAPPPVIVLGAQLEMQNLIPVVW